MRQVTHALLTRPPLTIPKNSPFDLHVLSTPPAFILSQDQTLMLKCLIPFRTTLGCSFRLLLFEFLFFMNHLSRCWLNACAFRLTHKRISRICICSLKNFACFILFSYQCSSLLPLFASALLDYHVSQTLSTTFFNFFQILFSKDLKRRKRDLNPRAAINDLLPFQGSPFGQLGYFSMVKFF